MLAFPNSATSYSAYSTPSVETAYFFPVEMDEDYIDAQKVVKTNSLPVGIAKVIGLAKDLWFTIGTFFSRIEHAPITARLLAIRKQLKGLLS